MPSFGAIGSSSACKQGTFRRVLPKANRSSASSLPSRCTSKRNNNAIRLLLHDQIANHKATRRKGGGRRKAELIHCCHCKGKQLARRSALIAYLYAHERNGNVLDVVDAARLPVVLVNGRKPKANCTSDREHLNELPARASLHTFSMRFCRPLDSLSSGLLQRLVF